MNQLIQIYFDGGCRPTNPGNKYGSYEVLLNGESIKTVNELELGHGTNNEAEFEILIEALKWLHDLIGTMPAYPHHFNLVVYTDSKIVLNRLMGRNTSNRSEPQQRMYRLTRACRDLIGNFMTFDAKWEGRDCNVARFGH